MTRYCGTCGARLDDIALAAGRCLVCCAPITDPWDVIAEAPTQPLDGPLGLAPLKVGAPAAEAGWTPIAREVAA
jgi:hypothetical protein